MSAARPSRSGTGNVSSCISVPSRVRLSQGVSRCLSPLAHFGRSKAVLGQIRLSFCYAQRPLAKTFGSSRRE